MIPRFLKTIFPRVFPLLRRTSLSRFKSDVSDRKAVQKLLKGELQSGKSIFPEPKMLIGFTCKVCDHRSHHTMSKNAYKHGTVLIQCPGCRSRHLIADHLNWFDSANTGQRTIEEWLKARGEPISTHLDPLLEWTPEDQ